MKIPVSIITGILGSGKTTFVNYVLTAEHGLRIGVIVNEFGDIGIDGSLIVSSSERLVELANGCLCCEVRGDLVDAAKELLAQGIDYLLVETSGLAEVTPVAMTFDTELLENCELDSIICVVDAENYDETIKRFATTMNQLQCSDILLLNKVDLVDEKKLLEIEAHIRDRVAHAQIIRTVKGQAPLELLLSVKRYSKGQLQETDHAHERVQSATLRTGAVDSDKAQEFLEHLPQEIYRAKGILCIKESEEGLGDELRIVFQKVGKRTSLEFSRPWEEHERKETAVVVIGTDIDAKTLQEGLERCA